MMKTNYLVLLVALIVASCNKDDCDIVVDDPSICEMEDNGVSVAFATLIEEKTFDGSNSNIVDLGSFNFLEGTDFTFAGRVNATNLYDFGRIWDFGPTNANFRFHHNINNTGRVAIGEFDHILDVTDFWELNTWIDVVVKYISANKELSLYKNGDLVGSLTNVVLPSGQRDNLIIGGSNWESNFPNSPEPNSILRTRNFHFYFANVSIECIKELLDQ